MKPEEFGRLQKTTGKGGILMGGPGGLGSKGGGFFNDKFAFVLFLILILLILGDVD